MRRHLDALRSERGVFVPGLMGAGILVSIVMLVTDGVRKLFPVRGDRARAARMRSIAMGRANDLLAVGKGIPPEPATVRHVPRSRWVSLLLGVLAAAGAAAVLATTQSFFNDDIVDLAGREEWGFGLGWGTSALLATGAVVWLLSAAFGSRRPEWVTRLASVPPLGTLPEPHEAVVIPPLLEIELRRQEAL